jgi:sec-independent protein translocase protein TatA
MEGILAPWHWAILIGVILLVFGPRKLPELGSSLGKGIAGFKRGLSATEEELKSTMAEATSVEPAQTTSAAAPSAEAAIAAPCAEASVEKTPEKTPVSV